MQVVTRTELVGCDCPVLDSQSLTTARVVVVADATAQELTAANHLIHHIHAMTGVRPSRVNVEPDDPTATIRLVVGRACHHIHPASRDWFGQGSTASVVDAIRVKRVGRDVLILGSNDAMHIAAVGALLEHWGCRWIMPGPFGACIPRDDTLSVDGIDIAERSPFPVRTYWVSFKGCEEHHEPFRQLNRMTEVRQTRSLLYKSLEHRFTKDQHPSLTLRQFDLNDATLINEVIETISEPYLTRESISLHCTFGLNAEQASQVPRAYEVTDKYFQMFTSGDRFFHFYNRIAEALSDRYPWRSTRIVVWAYGDLLIPPQTAITLHPSIDVMFIAISNNFYSAMSGSRLRKREHVAMLRRWRDLTDGRLTIYDYDQTQMIWRDIPNITVDAFAEDVKLYRDLGLRGVSTETRGLGATTIFNLYVRAKLLWNPDLNVDDLLQDAYQAFFGPLADPLGKYWECVRHAWRTTVATEKEYFIAPVVYPPEVLTDLKRHLSDAETLAATLDDNAYTELHRHRLEFTRLSFELTTRTVTAWRIAAEEARYGEARDLMQSTLALREAMAELSPNLVPPKESVDAHAHDGYYTLHSEIKTFDKLDRQLNGTDGQLVQLMDHDWTFRRDPHDTGVMSGWAYLAPPEASDRQSDAYTVRTSYYIQAQDALFDRVCEQGGQSPRGEFEGVGWYFTTFTFDGERQSVHLLFPAIFNVCWLYLNGHLIAHRPFAPAWWQENRYEDLSWDVDVSDHLQAENRIALRIHHQAEYAGMIRRPLLYRPNA